MIFIVFFFTIIELPALVILGFWFVQQVLFGYFDLNSGGEGGGVAYFAHIGGFVFGLAAIKLFADERKRRRQEEAAFAALAMRTAITFVALAFTTMLGFLTLYVIFETGLDVLSAISLIVVALFFFGIFGALGPEALSPCPTTSSRADGGAGGGAGRRCVAVLALLGAGIAAGLTLAPDGRAAAPRPPAPRRRSR